MASTVIHVNGAGLLYRFKDADGTWRSGEFVVYLQPQQYGEEGAMVIYETLQGKHYTVPPCEATPIKRGSHPDV